MNDLKTCIMKTKELLLLMALPALTTFSCTNDSKGTDEFKKIVNMVPDRKPIRLTKEQQTFANENNQFALNFLQTIDEADQSEQSYIYSPLSITYVLGMVNDAAEGTTRDELEQTLGFHEGGIEAVNEYCKTLIEKLPLADESVNLNIVNAIFLNKQYTLKKQFLEDIQQYYHAKAEALDFESPKTLSHINGWCNEQTRGMIPTIIESVNKDAVSYLLNAIYFKADWASKFDQNNTKTETFTAEDKTTQKVPLMHQEVLIGYMKNDVFSLVDLPYGNDLWSMTVMLPREGKTTSDIIQWLAENGWPATYVENHPLFSQKAYEVDLKLPRFKTTSDTDELDGTLVKLLQTMGIRMTFTEWAEIPNMCEQSNVYISMMRQKAMIEVNEKGAEAAAVTVAEAEVTSAGPTDPIEIPKATFHANRPFVYLIRERSSGVLLFVGKYTGK